MYDHLDKSISNTLGILLSAFLVLNLPLTSNDIHVSELSDFRMTTGLLIGRQEFCLNLLQN